MRNREVHIQNYKLKTNRPARRVISDFAAGLHGFHRIGADGGFAIDRDAEAFRYLVAFSGLIAKNSRKLALREFGLKGIIQKLESLDGFSTLGRLPVAGRGFA